MKQSLVFALGLLIAGCSVEPRQDGYPISYWRKELKKDNYMDRQHACLEFVLIAPQGKEAIPDLITCLHDDHFEVRQSAAMALGKMGPDAQAAVPRLRELAQDKVSSVRQMARMALRGIDRQAWLEATKGLDEE